MSASSTFDEDYYFIALTLVKDVGNITAKKLLAVYKNPKTIFEVSEDELSNIEDVGERRANAIKTFSEWKKIDDIIKAIQSKGAWILKITDNRYPKSLREIDDSPIILYCLGEYKKEDNIAIAIVGSRRMSEYGRRVASQISRELSSIGVTIVSGFARGIDTVAHRSALDAGGRSIAILGSGIDIIYPTENRLLFDKIKNSGCIMTEFTPNTPPDKFNFPKRNRIISGLSLGVLVVEAAMGSGSLITAHYATEQNKEVFAVPGNITNTLSQGTNALIKKGAKLVQKTEDIIEELIPQLKGLIKETETSKNKLEITDKEDAILKVLKEEPTHIDDIVRQSGYSIEEALTILLELELKGIIMQKEGKRFLRN
ncbi:MAG: DNA-processing protein DprA [Thermodesulfovibrionales bacterium]|nr:DNA-processing protein DprA [Thermodesulfovibrionales bacterium]